jgi:hypothetical protein
VKGQVLIELAIALPVLLLLLLGLIGTGYAFLSRMQAQNGITVLAGVAATDPGESWPSIVEDENRRTNCHADPLMPETEYPDGNAEPGSRIVLRWFCHLRTGGWLFDGLGITVEAGAVIGATP